ncbi:hypothetical protein HD554DRAFT_2039769 [Boletus coccyginus]|nr:hypothetical protein HD554DRAFT_2039769 [Boletus coccyginus]
MSTGPLVPLLGPLYGSLYFATVMSSGFYGIACMQTTLSSAYQVFDPATRMILYAQRALLQLYAFKHLMAGLANPFSLQIGTPYLPRELMVLEFYLGSIRNSLKGTSADITQGLTAGVTQGYFVYRIYLCCLGGRPVCIHAVDMDVLGDKLFMILATSSLSVTAGIDILIAIFLTFLLVRKRSAIVFSSTAHVLQRLIVFAVNTGTWTAMFALLSLILLHLFPSNMIYTVFVIPLCPVYCNTVLANLNARAYVRAEATRHSNGGVDLFAPTSPACDSTRDGKSRGEANLGIWKTTEVVTFADPHQSIAAAVDALQLPTRTRPSSGVLVSEHEIPVRETDF